MTAFKMPHGSSLFESLNNFRALIDKIKSRGWIRGDEAITMMNHCRSHPEFAKKLSPQEYAALEAAAREAASLDRPGKILFMSQRKPARNTHVTSKPSSATKKPGAGSDSLRQFHNLVAQIQRKRSVTPGEAEQILSAVREHPELAKHLSRDEIARMNDAVENANVVRF
jgi:hypothetical protein